MAEEEAEAEVTEDAAREEAEAEVKEDAAREEAEADVKEDSVGDWDGAAREEADAEVKDSVADWDGACASTMLGPSSTTVGAGASTALAPTNSLRHKASWHTFSSFSHATGPEDLISRYAVPSSRVLNVTQILGRPLPPKSQRDLNAGSVLAFDGPPAAAPSRPLSLADLKRIALKPTQPLRRSPVSSVELATPGFAGSLAHAAESSRGEAPVAPLKAQSSRPRRRKSSSVAAATPGELASKQAKAKDSWGEEETAEEGSVHSSGVADQAHMRSRSAEGTGNSRPSDSPGGALHGQLGRRRDNPFVAFEDRELRLRRERQWLQNEPDHFLRRFRELSLGSIMGKLERDARDPDERFEEALFHTPYSVKVQALVALRTELKRLKTSENFSGSSAEAKRMMTSGREQFRKLMKKGNAPQPVQEAPVKGKRSEQTACVRLLRELKEDLIQSNRGLRTQQPKPVEKKEEAFGGLRMMGMR